MVDMPDGRVPPSFDRTGTRTDWKKTPPELPPPLQTDGPWYPPHQQFVTRRKDYPMWDSILKCPLPAAQIAPASERAWGAVITPGPTSATNGGRGGTRPPWETCLGYSTF